MKTFFCEILLPLPLPGTFTYRVKQEHNENIEIGKRVIVQFGKKKVITGVIVSIHHTPPQGFDAKYIIDILDEFPIIHELQLRFFDWIANYYLCHLGEVLKAALPSGLKLSSDSKVQLNPDIDIDNVTLNEKEELIVNAFLSHDTLDYKQISEIAGIKNIYSLLHSLIKKNIILLFEEVHQKYKPKLIKHIKLSDQYTEQESLNQLLESLSTKGKQLQVIDTYLQLIDIDKQETTDFSSIERKKLTEKNISKSSLNTLIKNQILEEFLVTTSRLDETQLETEENIELSTDQLEVKSKIIHSFNEEKPALLHGITGSGKTAIYISLIKDVINSGQTALLLLPEIALTTQIVKRLKKYFGNKMAIYHSRFSDNERVEVWKGILEEKFDLVVGVRSSVFLPFKQLGLIIVDEEHDSSYKQYDPAPRYNAKDAALVLAQLHHSKIVLGSATPSVESYYLSNIIKKWNYIPLMKRYGEAALPKIIYTKIKYFGKAHNYSQPLLTAIEATLDKKKQIILFQNRRGYAPFLMCNHCQHIPKCVRCSVSLTYHQYQNQLVCHYCGYSENIPSKCSSCGSTEIPTVGLGTEKIEDDMKLRFPEATIKRMDLDTTRRKDSYNVLIQEFEEQETDILVGTQMVTKGLNFENVNLVGVIGIDNLLFFPDFRARERVFQLLTQVSGRAGRKEDTGTVIIQTSNPQLEIFSLVSNTDYISFYKSELKERKLFNYPPFYRMIKLTVKNKDKGLSAYTAQVITTHLKRIFKEKDILGPQEAMISKVRNLYNYEVFIKIKRDDARLVEYKKRISKSIQKVLSDKKYNSSIIQTEVDPI